MKPADEIKRLIHESEIVSGPGSDERILSDAFDLLDKRCAARTARPTPALWRTIMRNRVTQIAATVTIVVAILVAIHILGSPIGSTVTFASVVKPILNADTAEFDIIIGEDAPGTPVIHDMVMGSRIRRTLSTVDDAVSIIDLEDGTILALSGKDRTAQFVSLEGLPSMPNYLEQLKNVIVMLQDESTFEVEELGEREIDGTVLVGFHATHPKVDITLWADPTTGLPVRIEQNEGQMHLITKNMLFNVPMDETLFSMDAPEGYTLQGETTLDLQGGTEEAFIAGLRLVAEMFNEGRFPDGVAVEEYIKQAPAIAEKLESMGLSDEEETAVGVTLQNFLLFTRFFQGEGKWYYRGQGVMLGESDKAIFWYRPRGSATYRVIYGDLHVEDVAPEDLPEPLDANDTTNVGAEYLSWSQPDFLGSQTDDWTIEAGGQITVESEILLTGGPQGVAVLPATLPYATATMISATHGQATIPFTALGQGVYELQLSQNALSAGERRITCRWQLSLSDLPERQHGDLAYYEVALRSLVPASAYSLTAHIAPDSGFEFSTDPSKTSQALFSMGRAEGKTEFGTCGLPIQKRN